MNNTDSFSDRDAHDNHIKGQLQKAKKDNLCIILGINKPIEYLLNQQQVTTYEQLSNCSFSFISTVTSKLVTSHANTWPHQAQLAKKSKWKALLVYQYHIKLKTAGRLAYEEI